ncbi:MAG: RNA polymerase sigma factor [Flammeovirgaceae bacterium]
MNQVKQGDLDKMGLLFERHNRPLFGFFYHLTRQGDVSEDLVQTVFYRMLKYRKNFRGEGKFTTWMYHIARNVATDYRKKNRPIQYTDEFSDWEERLSDGKTIEKNIQAQEDQQLLKLAMGKLSPEKREILILSKYQKLKHDEIGQILGCKPGTAKVRIFRALQDLKNIFLQLTKEVQP